MSAAAALPRPGALARLARCLAAALACLALAGCHPVPPRPEAASGDFLARELVLDGRSYRYRVFVPAAPGPRPVVLFLHGSGERGGDNLAQTRVGLGPYLRTQPDFPAIVVFPQSPAGESWEGRTAAMAMAALEQASREFGGDRARTYLTGMSRGGYGTVALALAHPGRFAALVPVCGGVTAPGTRPDLDDLYVHAVAGAHDPFAAAAHGLARTPVWLYHGAADPVVPAAQSRRLHASLQAAGAPVRYTELPGVGHDAWDAAYRDPALWRWLFAQRLR
mgnify:CR=1 FL=1